MKDSIEVLVRELDTLRTAIREIESIRQANLKLPALKQTADSARRAIIGELENLNIRDSGNIGWEARVVAFLLQFDAAKG